jgi:hypothetical protein
MTSNTLTMTTRRSRVVDGSCWYCRKRRLKCNLDKPACSQCHEKEQTCSYSAMPPIKWVGGAASRGRLAESRSPKSPPSPGLMLATPSASLPLEHKEVLMYFANAVLPRFQIPDEPINLDLESVTHDEALQQTVVAVAQAHYALNSKVADMAIVRKRARQSAIEGFRKCLAQGVQSESSAQRLFAINILLCILDGMIEPSEELNASTCHLRGGFALLDQWANTPTRMLLQDGINAHLLSIYATMDLVHALLSGDKPFFESMIWRLFADVQTWFGRLRSGDRFLDILAAFSDMAALGNLLYNNASAQSAALVEKCLAPIEGIFSPSVGYDWRYRRSSSNSGGFDSIEDAWHTFCSVYEICGHIYLQRALRGRPIDDETVQLATRRGVEKLMDDELPAMMKHCLVFPMLVIGSHCTLAQDRKAVLDVLSPSCSYLSFGNMQLMTDFLRCVWQQDEVQAKQQTWWQCFAPVSQKAFLF